MRSQINTAWIIGVLATAGLIGVSGSEAQAKGGLSASMGSTQQSGDPPGFATYNYIFDIVLDANSTLNNGGFITIYDLASLGTSSFTQQPSLKWGSEVAFLGVTPAGYTGSDNPSLYNVTWQWNGGTITAGATDMLLGVFKVGPTIELSSPPPTQTLNYVGSLDGTNASNMGTVMVSYVVPEPSSLVLLMVGSAGLIPLAWIRKRRQTHRQD